MSPKPRVLVVSPHFDDVPLSLGESLRTGALSECRVRVQVVFGRTNWTRWFHPTPARAHLAGLIRRTEELAASLRFGYRWRTGSWAESVLRTGELDAARFLDPDRDLSAEPLVAEVRDWLRTVVSEEGPDLMLVAGGLGGHVDHRIVARAAAGLVGQLGVPIGFYEDRPYVAYLDPAEIGRQLGEVERSLGGLPNALDAVPLESVDVSGPVTAATQRWVRRCYPSQIDEYFVASMELDLSGRRCERVWFPSGTRPEWFGRSSSR